MDATELRFRRLEGRMAIIERQLGYEGVWSHTDTGNSSAPTGSGLCPKCGCNTSRTDDKKQFECIGCGHVWICEAAGDGPHHRFEKLETEEDWRNAMVDPFGERAK